jgi:hypothetical protein
VTEEELAKFETFVDRYTRENTLTKAAAGQALMKEGILDQDGRLKPEFGGRTKARAA